MKRTKRTSVPADVWYLLTIILKEASCIRRLKDAEEDLYTVVYECAEGKNTAFIFQYPVKYLDENDEVRDISTAIR
ncbi:MAG: hypothetical protein J6Y48_14760, partial [Clostridia bacterium]|nr:hypothetical protein [Clostridia bacterium]